MLTLTQGLILTLAIIAGIVAIRQAKQANTYGGWTWWLICLYWIVLTLKNLVDWSETM